MTIATNQFLKSQKPTESLSGVTVRLAGDSGDGMQLLGTQLTNTSALCGNDVATFPDFPAEIRAPRGTRAGVSGFQVQFSAEEIFTPGDGLDALVVMNPAALVTNLADLKKTGILIINSDSFEAKDLKLANLDTNPLEDGTIEGYRAIHVPMTQMTRGAVEPTGLSTKLADRCKNFFAMGLVFWLYGRDVEPTLRFIEAKFSNKPDIAEANRLALQAGWNYGETTEDFVSTYQVPAAELAPGTYRNIMGNQALAWGLITAAKLSGKELFLGSYPITPASDIQRYSARVEQAQEFRGPNISSRRRNCCRLCHDWRGVWWIDGANHLQRTGNRAQGRRHGVGVDARAADDHRRCATWRSEYRIADQNRTV